MAQSERMQEHIQVTVAKGVQTSSAFGVAEVASGVLFTPATLTSITTRFLVCTSKAQASYLPVCDTSGAKVQCQLTASQAIKIPDEVFLGGYQAELEFFRTEAAARVLYVATKS